MKAFKLELVHFSYNPLILFIFIFSTFPLLNACAPTPETTCQSSKCIKIESDPAADIYVNGMLAGTGSLSRVGVAEGALIELKKPGYDTASISIGKVGPNRLSITRAVGHAGISISGEKLRVRLKKK